MSDATPSGDLPNPLWDRRWLLAGQAVVALAVLAVFVVVVEPTWHWRLFLWGVAIGLAASALFVGIGRRATRELRPERRLRLRRQLFIYATAWAMGGVLAGFGSAMVDSAWPNLLLLAFQILTVVLLAVVVVNVRRRRP
jgi:MFS family permease